MSLLFRRVTMTVAIACFWAVLSIPARADALGEERGKTKMILNVVAKEIEREYYDPAMHGVDWKASVAAARKKIDEAKSLDEMMSAIYGLVESLHDSHTIFLPPSRTSKITFGFEAKMYGDEARIWKVRKNSPAEKAGLLPGDKLLQVNGFNVERKTFELMMLYFRALHPVDTLDMYVKRGDEPAREVRFRGDVKRDFVVKNLDNGDAYFDLLRDMESEANEQKYFYGISDEVGYVSLPDFSAEKDFFQGLLQESKKAKAFVVDLRGNAGGAIDSLGTFAGFFESEATSIGDVVSRRKTEPIKVKPSKPNFTVPLFILVDSETASSAEIFAYHFQKKGRAVVIGDNTAAAVMAARYFPESIGADVVIPFGTEITVGKIVFPGGEQLEGKGIVPDHLCMPTSEQMREGKDACRSLAYDLAKKAIAAASSPAATSGK